MAADEADLDLVGEAGVLHLLDEGVEDGQEPANTQAVPAQTLTL